MLFNKQTLMQQKVIWQKRLQQHWIGTSIIIVATAIFFWPIITNISNYSEGGDTMFNAWTLSRNHHCILRQDCPDYTDANIYFPHKDTMLYSETQLSAGLLTLPLYFLNKNPLFAFNVFTIISFFLAGWFMYLLAKRLSKGHEAYSVMAGLVFEFAPLKLAAFTHLQNLSIFYLPLIVLLILAYLDKAKRKYLVGLLIALTLQFYASWYQMVFVLIALAVMIGGMRLVKIINWQQLLRLSLITIAAILLTLPLAKEYIRFSKSDSAGFSIQDQVKYSASLADYVMPHAWTAEGKLYHALKPNAQLNSYNPDSYSYHGLIMYIIAAVLLVVTWRNRKTGKKGRYQFRFVLVLIAMAAVAFIISLGPLLKLQAEHVYNQSPGGLHAVIPMPWLLVDMVLPQLSFIRAIGRISVIVLFVLCCLLALWPAYMQRHWIYQRYKTPLLLIIGLLIAFELMPLHMVQRASQAYFYQFDIPKVYQYIKQNKQVDHIVIISAESDYPGATIPVARAEQIMWSGYHNRRIFNGYSGYTPPTYFEEIGDFNNFHPDDVAKMKQRKLRYVIVDKELSVSDPTLRNRVDAVTHKVYEDNRYALFRL